ncbi:LAQU0S23e00892g1_1 [Lachancea quebecensis]|uniref:LAQU0S23e00892g1_1 n=1 Tax=Lachancea quebecensis TaxID=1654605 RepID=A0A0N7MMG0_9SACH|nr:LAQU0S23e00892g1_1 [Lachancea quebecensis]
MATYQPYNEFSTVSGGGFDNSQSSGRPNSGNGGSGSSSTLTPVTIKQVQESKQMVQDGPFVVNNLELHHVSFVGVVRNVVDNTSNINLTIEDGTGQIEVRKWSDDSNDMANAAQDEQPDAAESSQVAQMYEVGTYVRVFGALREFSGKKNVQFAVIKPVENFNEVITHYLEAMKWHAIANGKLESPVNPQPNSEQAGEEQNLFVQDNSASEPKTALHKILEFCTAQCEGKDASSFAVHTKLIAQSLALSEPDVKMFCQTLVDQGFIYPTFDDSSFFVL